MADIIKAFSQDGIATEIAKIPFCGFDSFIFNVSVKRNVDGMVNLNSSTATAVVSSLKEFNWGSLSYDICAAIDISSDGVVIFAETEESEWLPLELSLAGWLRVLRFNDEGKNDVLSKGLRMILEPNGSVIRQYFDLSFGFAKLFPGLALNEVKHQGGIEESPVDVKTGYIYLIGSIDSDFLKIGFSRNPKKRLKDLQTSHPQKLELIAKKKGSLQDEKIVHQLFADLRESGEWFRKDDRILNYFKVSRRVAS